jgi:hypothetical protein
MISRYEANWSHQVNHNLKKLQSYKNFKKEFSLENYITSQKLCKRKYFTKLRISAHCLHSETGRHKRPVVVPELRTCKVCNDGSIENEKHFLLNCKLYKDHRTTLFKSLSYINFNNYSENDKFTFLMSTGNGDTEIIKEVLKFVNSAYEIRLANT